LQCVAVCCSVLQCVAMRCSVLQCDAVCCSVLQCVAVWCSVLQRVAVCCSMLQSVAVCCSVVQCVPNCTCFCRSMCHVVHVNEGVTNVNVWGHACECVVGGLLTVAGCCSVLQNSIVCCNVLQRCCSGIILAHMSESCHTYKHIAYTHRQKVVARMNESHHTYNESHHTCK